MKQFVVTIARENGSGGRAVGEALAGALGVPFYNRSLLRLASDESGISEELFGRADEAAKHRRLFRIAQDACSGEVIPPDQSDFTSNENLFRYQAKIIRRLAETESCVIIGRAADYVLRDRTNVVRVFIHAPESVRVRELMHRDGISDEAARKAMVKIDKQRGTYYRTFTGSDWRDAGHYDLSIDSSALGLEGSVALIKGFLELKLGE